MYVYREQRDERNVRDAQGRRRVSRTLPGICFRRALLTGRVVLWLVFSLEATERAGGAKHDGPVCPGQPAASATSRQAHRSWETRSFRLATE